MRQVITNLEDLCGKTIEQSIDCPDKLVLTFSDETYAVIHSEKDGWGDDVELIAPSLQPLPKPTEADDRSLYVDSGIYTPEEFDVCISERRAEKAKRDTEYEKQRDESDRATYERLKAKFG